MPGFDFVQLDNNTGIFGREDGQSAILDMAHFKGIDWSAAQCTHTSTPSTTRSLLRAAISAGAKLADNSNALDSQSWKPTKPDKTRETQYSLLQFIYSLVGAYQQAEVVPEFYRRAADTFFDNEYVDYGNFCLKKAAEETNHDLLAYKDLAALGLPAGEVTQVLRPKHTRSMLALFDSYSRERFPVGVIGYSYFNEYFATRISKKDIEMADQLVPEGTKISRFLHVHSATGADSAHVADAEDFIAGCDKDHRALIARTVYETAALYFKVVRQLPSDREIADKLLAGGINLPASLRPDARDDTEIFTTASL